LLKWNFKDQNKVNVRKNSLKFGIFKYLNT
jgi:hypothetical protein